MPIDWKFLNDFEHWRDRAEEARVNAEHFIDSEARRMMLNIAASYDRIAEKAEQRAREREEVQRGQAWHHAAPPTVKRNEML